MPLLTTSSGEKLGKSSGNAVWLGGSSYQLYQAMLQVPDQDAATMLLSLTFLPSEEITGLVEQHSVRRPLTNRPPLPVPHCLCLSLQTCPEQFLAQRTLAEQVTRLVHGGRLEQGGRLAAQ